MASLGMPSSEDSAVYTIGHSTRTIPQFVELLRAGKVQLVVDIRHVPRSRTNPQYNFETLPSALSPYQIGPMRIAELGGRRKKSEVAPEVNGFWSNARFHNYADYALSEPFRMGWRSFSMPPRDSAPRSCAQRPCGGAAIDASSLTTSSTPAGRSITSWARTAWIRPR
jgi:hypothetical protein